jgi:hypothetical protein
MAINLQHAVPRVQQVVPQMGSASGSVAFVRSLWTRATRSLQSAVCGLHGHDPLLQVEQGRMFLRCASCGHETPGWSMSGRGPRQRFGGRRARPTVN